MRYLMMLYGAEARGDTPSQMSPDTARSWERYRARLEADGVLVQWAGLHPTTTAHTVRVRRGEVLVTDGPFAETREQLGGFFLVECAGLDVAREYAACMPCAPDASIEIRAIIEPATDTEE